MIRSKRYRQIQGSLDQSKTYSLAEAVDILKNVLHPKFDETIELSFRLNADPKKSEQMIRSSVVLPHGLGKSVKILVFCEPEKEDSARQAGADFVGGQDLIDKITKENWLDFDSCISTPLMMRSVSKLGRILGPRGMMPSPKTGTVTENISVAVKEAKAGKIEFRMDKLGCIACGIGKVSFSKENLLGNIKVFIDALNAARPSSVKGELIKSMYLSATMSPSLKIKL